MLYSLGLVDDQVAWYETELGIVNEVTLATQHEKRQTRRVVRLVAGVGCDLSELLPGLKLPVLWCPAGQVWTR